MQKAKHAYGSRKNLMAAIESGKVDAYDILLLNGEDESPAIGWVDKNGNPIIVESQSQIVHVDELPTVDGDVNVIYIYNNETYLWDGEKCVSTCKPVDLSALEAEMANKANAKEVKAEIAKAVTDTVASAKAYTDGKVESAVEAAMSEHLIKRYEVADVPAGTLVDYFDKEIRIMCPADAEFVKQSVGVGGNPNNYYMTFKTYAPSDDVVGYIEHLGDQADPEVLTDLKTDEYGRKYQPTWLGIANYNDATGWTYYGANSSTEKYIGWDYQIDWYNADGVMVKSDAVRINLSNEDCHNTIEPYYIGSVRKEIDTKIEEKIAEVEGAIEIVEF